VPPVHIKDNLQLNPNQYTLSLKGVNIATAEMMPGYYMAMDPGLVTETIKGLPTREPAFDLPAIWITEESGNAPRSPATPWSTASRSWPPTSAR
jgi:flagellar biosynthesis protein FlhA